MAKWYVPSFARGHLRAFVVNAITNETRTGDSDNALFLRQVVQRALFSPANQTPAERVYHFDESRHTAGSTHDGLPIPPPEMRFHYALESDERFIEDGASAAKSIRAVMSEHGVDVDAASRILDWGCASGRVLRHFKGIAERGEAWGCDQSEPHIQWCRKHLAPPFRFVSTSEYPHLPFEDNYFDFLYGVSVFTHIDIAPDMWLLELRRILKPGAYACFTVHTHGTLDHFQKTEWPDWLPSDFDIESAKAHDLCVVASDEWKSKHLFYRESYLERFWGLYFNWIRLYPLAMDAFHNIAVLQKPAE